MFVSFVLRLDATRLADGELVGEIEDVATADRHPMHGCDSILTFTRAHAGGLGIDGPDDAAAASMLPRQREPDEPRSAGSVTSLPAADS